MRMVKSSYLRVTAGLMPVLAGFLMITSPLISYLAWALGQLVLSPSMPRDYQGPATVLDFIALQSGYMILGVVLAFIGFPAFSEALKVAKHDADEHDFLVKRLLWLSAPNQASMDSVNVLSTRELVYQINKLLGEHPARDHFGEISCFKCGTAISSSQNEKYAGSCPRCHYHGVGIKAYGKAMAVFTVAILILLCSFFAMASILAWIALVATLIASIFWANGHYMIHRKV